MFSLLVGLAFAAPLTVDEIVRAALDHHPDVIAARGDVLAASGQRAQVGTILGNPEVQAGFSTSGDLTFVQAQQPLSLTGEGWFARKVARFARDAAVADLRRTELLVAADARMAWVDAVLADRRAALAEGTLTLASRLRAAAEARAGAGDSSRLDVALARSREVAAAAETLVARRERSAALAALTAFHADVASLGVAGAPAEAVPAARGASSRGDVVAAEARVAETRASLSRNRAGAIPAIAAGVQYQSDGGSTDFGPMLTVALPIFDRNQAGIAAAHRDADVAVANLDAARARAETEGRLGDALADSAGKTWTIVDGADAAASDGLGFVEAGFERGEIDLRDAVLLQRELVDGRLAALAAEREVIAAGLSALLAHDDVALLGGTR